MINGTRSAGSKNVPMPVSTARDTLEAAGADVSYRESPLPHTIDPAVVPEVQVFVAAALAR